MKLYADDFFISNSLPNMQKPLNVYGEINMPKKTRRTVRFQQFSVKTLGDCFRIRPFAMTHYENFIRHCERSEAISRVFKFTENCGILPYAMKLDKVILNAVEYYRTGGVLRWNVQCARKLLKVLLRNVFSAATFTAKKFMRNSPYTLISKMNLKGERKRDRLL